MSLSVHKEMNKSLFLSYNGISNVAPFVDALYLPFKNKSKTLHKHTHSKWQAHCPTLLPKVCALPILTLF